MKICLINPEVKQALAENHLLAIAFFAKHDDYDDEIDPLHNKDYREFLKKKEVELLEECKAVLVKVNKYFGV